MSVRPSPSPTPSSDLEITWSRSAVKWVTVRDRATGVEATGRDDQSWDAAMMKAITSLRRRQLASAV